MVYSVESLGLLDYLKTGQVLPTGSFIHRLDPRTRLLGFLGLLAAWIVVGRVGPALLALGVVIGLIVLARVPLRYALRGLWLLLPWLLFVAGVQLAFGVGDAPGCPALLAWGPLRVTVCTLLFALVTLIRFAGLALSIGLFAWTSPIPDLAHGLEALVAPLDRLRLPAHQLAMVGVIAIRFLPTMALELERLEKAQAARGADLTPGRLGFVQRVRRTLPLVVPLFVVALHRAERLAEAMEARAYGGGRGRGRYARLHFGWTDALALAWIGLFAIIVLILST